MVFKNKVVVITGGANGIDGGMTKQMIYHGDNDFLLFSTGKHSSIVKITQKLLLVFVQLHRNDDFKLQNVKYS